MGWSVAQPTGLTFERPNLTFPGYTLLCPTGDESVYLIDMRGRIVHTWSPVFFRCQHAKLLPNGNLLVMGAERSLRRPDPPMPGDPPLEFDQDVRRLGANATELRELDWDSNVIWTHRNWYLHHDFQRTDDGHTFVLEFAKISAELSAKVVGGFSDPGHDDPEHLIGDDVVELDSAGKEIGRLTSVTSGAMSTASKLMGRDCSFRCAIRTRY